MSTTPSTSSDAAAATHAEIAALVQRARAAQEAIAHYTQEQVDALVLAVGWSVVKHKEALARAALLALRNDLPKRLRGRKFAQRRPRVAHPHRPRDAARDRLVEAQLLTQVAHAGLLEPDRREDPSEARLDTLRTGKHALQWLGSHFRNIAGYPDLDGGEAACRD